MEWEDNMLERRERCEHTLAQLALGWALVEALDEGTRQWSHDIRSSLTTANGNMSLLAEAPGHNSSKRWVDNSLNSLDQISDRVDSCLDSVLSCPARSREWAPTSLVTVLNDAATVLVPTTGYGPQIEVAVYGDADSEFWLAQRRVGAMALWSLASMASRFAIVRAEVLEQTDEVASPVLMVRVTGSDPLTILNRPDLDRFLAGATPPRSASSDQLPASIRSNLVSYSQTATSEEFGFAVEREPGE